MAWGEVETETKISSKILETLPQNYVKQVFLWDVSELFFFFFLTFWCNCQDFHFMRIERHVEKMPNTRGEIRWRWLKYQCLLGKMSSSRKFVTCFRKLAWIYVIKTFRPVIVWRIKTEQLSNLPTERIVSEFWE